MDTIFTLEENKHMSEGRIDTPILSMKDRVGEAVLGISLVFAIFSAVFIGVENWRLANTLDTAQEVLELAQKEQENIYSGSEVDTSETMSILDEIRKSQKSWSSLIQEIRSISSKGEIEIQKISGDGLMVDIEIRSLNSAQYSLTAAAKFADKLSENTRIKKVEIPQATKKIRAGDLAESQIVLQAELES